MSRVAKNPITLPSGVDVNLNGSELTVKGTKGTMKLDLHAFVTLKNDGGMLTVVPVKEGRDEWAMAGTFRALVGNMVTGVSAGFQKKLQLVGVGYRAQAKGNVLNMNLGFSHPVDYPIPEGITIETPSQTEIVVSGCDKQRVGQVSAEIRAYRPPEPYKGKGVRYADEHVARKEAKKK
ncbi:50S ribosomal protein L6 [Sedimenticola selenatireducens]|uniref:Large ribosomal subunit protein uL6 n=1 Tax=Sedimenticola selenatireducens TaxID=191960 RepID=A0A2N6CYB2_9GAMM|nr:50S ribosomal protein L6 [Sedimenticola selenatireducens]PLX62284.1 MAG: 50S ribosomal protein L6 [Sedimenticola selenatireducens]